MSHTKNKIKESIKSILEKGGSVQFPYKTQKNKWMDLDCISDEELQSLIKKYWDDYFPKEFKDL